MVDSELRKTGSDELKKLVLIVVALIAVGTSLFFSYRIGLRANRDEHELGHYQDGLVALRVEIAKLEGKLR